MPKINWNSKQWTKPRKKKTPNKMQMTSKRKKWKRMPFLQCSFSYWSTLSLVHQISMITREWYTSQSKEPSVGSNPLPFGGTMESYWAINAFVSIISVWFYIEFRHRPVVRAPPALLNENRKRRRREKRRATHIWPVGFFSSFYLFIEFRPVSEFGEFCVH